MTDEEIKQWIEACNHEPAREVLREYMVLKAAVSADVAALVKAIQWYGEQARMAKLITSDGDPGRWALAADGGARAKEALSPQVQDGAEASPEEYMRRHDAAIAAYEANTPSDSRYSALALRKAVDAAFAVAASPASKHGDVE